MNSIDEDTLQAYADGELDAAATARIDAALARDEVLARIDDALERAKISMNVAEKQDLHGALLADPAAVPSCGEIRRICCLIVPLVSQPSATSVPSGSNTN